MSRETVQFAELVRERYAAIQHPAIQHPLFCQQCGKETDHVYLGDQGNCERYQCPCGLIRSVAVR